MTGTPSSALFSNFRRDQCLIIIGTEGRTTHGGVETSSGAIPAGVSLKPVLKGGISEEEMTAIPEGTPIIIFRTGGTAGGSALASRGSSAER